MRRAMTKCPSCLSVISDEQNGGACPSCGSPLTSDPDAPTLLESVTHNLPSKPAARSKSKTPTGRVVSLSSSESLDGARFVPGTMLAGRYRIVGLLGRGGMGEVYRADDLKLSQPVALKFLPEAMATNGAALARFHREVRVARGVSHRNVCRVYDIGEMEGMSFLSMEYIRGEELSSLLKRIGRLPPDKALEISRQLCAGLAAAHDNNVLHRDFKPANVMIDDEGNVRILDFGLAGIEEEFGHEELRAGTPAYMAPEQLAGQEVTKQSDIYALGLVLYEVFTGKRAFEARTIGELLRLREEATPTNPSQLVKDIDPLVERTILRCLESAPPSRPATALQVAAMLPGGDPLAAALAAGETPSPEMVAAAGTQSGLRQSVAVACLAASLMLLAALVMLADKVLLHAWAPMEKSPEVLSDRARSLMGKLNPKTPAVSSVEGVEFYETYLRYLLEHDAVPARREKLRSGQPAAISFWYRQSPRYIESRDFMNLGATQDDPPLQTSGEALVRLDMRGRLLELNIVPPQLDEQATAASQPDWSALFNEAGFDISKFKATEPRWTPPVYGDTRAAWEGVYPDQPQIPIRVEAAAFRGQPVYFSIIETWSKPLRMQPDQESGKERAFWILLFLVMVAVIVAGALLARRNLRLGRGDRKGAFRVASFIFIVNMIDWALGATHVPTLGGEVFTFSRSVAWGLMDAGLLWLLYIALEPYVRRRWPHILISWSRLLAGSFRDPMVGRDILIGALLGLSVIVSGYLLDFLQRWTGGGSRAPYTINSGTFFGLRGSLRVFVSIIPFAALLQGLGLLFILLLLSMLLRKQWLAIGAFWLLVVVALGLAFSDSPLDLAQKMLAAAAFTFVLVRFGLLTVVFAQFFLLHAEAYPYTTNFSAWYAESAIFAIVTAAALIVYGFYISLAGRRVFRDWLLQE